jgi:hypothetical protein
LLFNQTGKGFGKSLLGQSLKTAAIKQWGFFPTFCTFLLTALFTSIPEVIIRREEEVAAATAMAAVREWKGKAKQKEDFSFSFSAIH